MGFLLPLHSKLVLLLFHVVVARSVSSFQPYSCHDEERSALLQFKQSLTINRSASGIDGAYPKVSSWKPAHNGENNSCCSWDGVQCDKKTGRVIELDLSSSCLHGSINSSSSLFHLVHLRSLNLACNNFNHSQILPSIMNFPRLRYLNLSYSAFSGQIPASLANLTQLKYLSLSRNNFNGPILASLANLTQLEYLSLSRNNFNGPIPASLANLTQLVYLLLSYNDQISSGPLSWVGKQTKLLALRLPGINLSGRIPSSLANLTQLIDLDLSENDLTGPIHTTQGSLPIPPQSIIYYQVENNKLTGEISPSFCNRSALQYLNLANNKLIGNIPQCLGNFIDDLQFLDLGSNLFHGSLPQTYNETSILELIDVSHNQLEGEIPRSLANCMMLEDLDLSNNDFSDDFPIWLGMLPKLKHLAMNHNGFYGVIEGTKKHHYFPELRILDLSYNQLEGKIPRSLANCMMLEALILSNNDFNDDFPIWLGMLPELKVLAMNHNGFYGVIEGTKRHHYFPELRILDLSYNNFTGEFSSEYIFFGNAMRGRNISQPTYMQKYICSGYDFSIIISNKGVQRYYERIQEDLGVIDISSNEFQGNIPEFIGKLKGLRILNFAHNKFTGRIPSLLGNLTLLESLDLSHNQLCGEIPQQLAQLTSLAFFNVSYNNITGSIPKGTQFQTFENTSFVGNPELCGNQLLTKCLKPKARSDIQTSGMGENDSGSGIEFDWKFILAGIVSGLLVGVVLADVAITRRPELFLEIVGMLIRTMKRIKMRNMLGHNN